VTPSQRTVVAVPIELRLRVPQQQVLPLPVQLGYGSDDPYAVSVAFQGPDEVVTWVFARDLLAEGLLAPGGEGDVTVRPEFGPNGEVLVIGLASPDGEAELEADADDVRDFLARTEQVLPRGQEHTVIDFDAELAQLLAES
jgi:hypothetical protein